MDLQLSFPSTYIYYIALLLLAVYCLAIALYRLFFSPLHSVPGPWYAAISDFWLITHVLRLRRCRAINDLLHKYGPIVRVAPNKVVFLDAPTMKTVYGVSSRLNKSIFYKSLVTYVVYIFRSIYYSNNFLTGMKMIMREYLLPITDAPFHFIEYQDDNT